MKVESFEEQGITTWVCVDSRGYRTEWPEFSKRQAVYAACAVSRAYSDAVADELRKREREAQITIDRTLPRLMRDVEAARQITDAEFEEVYGG